MDLGPTSHQKQVNAALAIDSGTYAGIGTAKNKFRATYHGRYQPSSCHRDPCNGVSWV